MIINTDYIVSMDIKTEMEKIAIWVPVKKLYIEIVTTTDIKKLPFTKDYTNTLTLIWKYNELWGEVFDELCANVK